MIYLALPVYNECDNIGPLLERIELTMKNSGEAYRVIAVDDGSDDGTPPCLQSYASRLPLNVLTHAKNMNLGPTIRDAITEALDHAKPEDVIITLDADNSHDPALFPQMRALVSNGHDLVVASRYVKGARVVGLSVHRRFFSWAVNSLLRKLSPIPNLTDYTCGYRAYRAELLSTASLRYGSRLIEEVGFACMTELLLKLRPLIRNAAEVPLILRYDLKRGKSKMKVIRTVMRYVQLFSHHWGKTPFAS